MVGEGKGLARDAVAHLEGPQQGRHTVPVAMSGKNYSNKRGDVVIEDLARVIIQQKLVSSPMMEILELQIKMRAVTLEGTIALAEIAQTAHTPRATQARIVMTGAAVVCNEKRVAAQDKTRAALMPVVAATIVVEGTATAVGNTKCMVASVTQQ